MNRNQISTSIIDGLRSAWRRPHLIAMTALVLIGIVMSSVLASRYAYFSSLLLIPLAFVLFHGSLSALDKHRSLLQFCLATVIVSGLGLAPYRSVARVDGAALSSLGIGDPTAISIMVLLTTALFFTILPLPLAGIAVGGRLKHSKESLRLLMTHHIDTGIVLAWSLLFPIVLGSIAVIPFVYIDPMMIPIAGRSVPISVFIFLGATSIGIHAGSVSLGRYCQDHLSEPS